MKMRKGFTLVELLIVIVIIGILAAAMLLSSATASAKATTLISDLRSMKAALLLMYANSMDSMPPVANALSSLRSFIDNPDKYVKTGSGFSISDGTDGKWYIGYDFTPMAGSDLAEVKKKLAEKAEKVGLFSDKTTDNSKVFKATDTAIYMVGR